MKTRKLIFYLLGLLILASCQSKGYKKLDDGIVVRLDQKSEDDAGLVKLQAITDDIIHVTASPAKTFSGKKSLIIEEKSRQPVEWSTEENGDHLLLHTSEVTASVSLITGEVVFYDNKGNSKLKEVDGGGKTFNSDTLDGKRIYKIRQIFDSPEDEAFYGLGQHQDDVMNYKGHNVELMQQNMVAVVPFLVSSKTYGILWDNYSITRFGDPREYEHLNTLKLYSEEDNPGGLTAKYILHSNPQRPFLKRVESKIDYEFRKSLANLPADFPLIEGFVEWKGFIESEFSGIHKFLLYSSGYTKVWLDGKLVVDKWRQWWLPWTNHIEFNMEKGRKYEIKVEWLPGGAGDFSNGPYIAFKWLSPVDEKEQNNLSLYSEIADEIDYYFINGDHLDEVISGYREITGKAPIMPKWAMGLWQSRERYKTQEELLGIVKEFREREIPLDNIVLDWFYWKEDQWGSHEFDPGRFPDPEGMINDLHEKYNARIMISVWPKFYEGIENYKLFDEKGWLYKRNVENQTKDWVGYVSTFYDAFNPEARELFWNLMNSKLYTKGIDAWWMDCTEPDINSNVSNEEKALLMNPTALGPGAMYMNAYSLMNSKGVYEGQREVNPDQRVFILTRSAFAGQQRYASATWSGDVAARWYDLKAQITAGLNFSLSGIPYWTTDIGGFSVEQRYEDATGDDLNEWHELMTRWFQFGTFCPLFRVHGQYPYREIFNVAPENHIAYKTMVKYDKLRYRLMPYIYSLAGQTYHDDYTIMRALIMDFAEDRNVYTIGDQYMFGSELMVCPVYEYKARSREVYLPETSGWYDIYSGKYYEGGQWVNAEAPLSRIPLYAKEGSILPIGPDIQYTTEKSTDPVTLFVYTGKNGRFVIYEDENVNYNYEKGMFSRIPIEYNEELRTIVIGERNGTFPGMLEERTFNIVWISKDKPLAFDYDIVPDKKVKYNGQEQVITME